MSSSQRIMQIYLQFSIRYNFSTDIVYCISIRVDETCTLHAELKNGTPYSEGLPSAFKIEVLDSFKA